MSTTTKPRRAALMSAASLPARDLTSAELALVVAYRTMDAEAKEFTLATASERAKRLPAAKPAPHLRLVPTMQKEVKRGCR